MATLKLNYVNHVQLRQKAEPIAKFDADLKQLAHDMLETMQSRSGVGIAGPQVGVMKQIFVIEIPADRDGPDNPPHPQSGKTYFVINPQIINAADKHVEDKEGCLSIPTWFGLVSRPEWVEIMAQDLDGNSFQLKANDLLGRAFQHEFDHLQGVLFIDHIIDPDKLWQTLPEA